MPTCPSRCAIKLRRRRHSHDAKQPSDARQLQDLSALQPRDEEPRRGEDHDDKVEDPRSRAQVMPDVPHVDEQVDDEDAPCDDVDRDEHRRVVGRPREGHEDRQDRREHERHASALFEASQLLEVAFRASTLSQLRGSARRRGSGTTRHDAPSCDAPTRGRWMLGQLPLPYGRVSISSRWPSGSGK